MEEERERGREKEGGRRSEEEVWQDAGGKEKRNRKKGENQEPLLSKPAIP